jgi:quercetin dioxygenase-like cupin family protein
VLEGSLVVVAGNRGYRLTAYDNFHVPAGLAHKVINGSGEQAVAHWAFASECPSRDLVEDTGGFENRGFGSPEPGDPETLVRFESCAVYELSPGAHFRDLFGSRFGAVGICGGYGLFEPGASLPCHVHQYDESITIVEGEAVCLVQGNRYQLQGYDTAFVPEGRPHRFLNHSRRAMAMIWVYAGGVPERTLVEAGYCDGGLAWEGVAQAEKASPEAGAGGRPAR